MQLGWPVLCFAALSLGGCCLSGTGCQVVPTATAVNWDGLDASLMDDDGTPLKPPYQPRKPTIDATAEATVTEKQPRSKAEMERQVLEADAKLRQKLVICRSCGLRPLQKEATRTVTRAPLDLKTTDRSTSLRLSETGSND